MIRVLVRSTSPFARAGLENAISADPRFEVVTERSSSFDLEQDTDVILLDGAEPDLERLRSTSSLPPHTPGVFFSLTALLERIWRALSKLECVRFYRATPLRRRSPQRSRLSLKILSQLPRSSLRPFCPLLQKIARRKVSIFRNHSHPGRRRSSPSWQKVRGTRRLRPTSTSQNIRPSSMSVPFSAS